MKGGVWCGSELCPPHPLGFKSALLLAEESPCSLQPLSLRLCSAQARAGFPSSPMPLSKLLSSLSSVSVLVEQFDRVPWAAVLGSETAPEGLLQTQQPLAGQVSSTEQGSLAIHQGFDKAVLVRGELHLTPGQLVFPSGQSMGVINETRVCCLIANGSGCSFVCNAGKVCKSQQETSGAEDAASMSLLLLLLSLPLWTLRPSCPGRAGADDRTLLA